MNKTLLRKIRQASAWGWDSSKIARYFGLSRYKVTYVLGKLKRSPRAYIGALERFLLGDGWAEEEEERFKEAQRVKEYYNGLIIKGKKSIDNPMERAKEYRQTFHRIFDCYPENIK